MFLRAPFDYAQGMFYGESISAFISVNQRFIKMLIHSTQYSLLTTHYEQRTPSHGES